MQENVARRMREISHFGLDDVASEAPYLLLMDSPDVWGCDHPFICIKSATLSEQVWRGEHCANSKRNVF